MRNIINIIIVLIVFLSSIYAIVNCYSAGSNCPNCIEAVSLIAGDRVGSCNALRLYVSGCLNACCVGPGTGYCGTPGNYWTSSCGYYVATSSPTYMCNCILHCADSPDCAGWYEVTNFWECKDRVYDDNLLAATSYRCLD